MDEEQQAAAEQARAIREDIRDLEKTLAELTARRNGSTNNIIKKRLSSSIEKVQSELRLKKASIGIVDE